LADLHGAIMNSHDSRADPKGLFAFAFKNECVASSRDAKFGVSAFFLPSVSQDHDSRRDEISIVHAQACLDLVVL
jgi:hypothetical protein